MAVVVYTSEYDPHSDVVIEALEAAQAEPIRINSDRLVETLDFHYDFERGTGGVTIRDSGRSFAVEQVEAVWLRRPGAVRPAEQLTPAEHLFLYGELAVSLMGLLDRPGVRWVNHPAAGNRALNKVFQLETARSLGLRVPQTLLSNRPEAVLDFFERHQRRMVYKSLEGASTSLLGWPVLRGLLESAEVSVPALGTIVVDESNVHHLAGAEGQPGLFQEVVDRDHELRVTVMGSEVHAVRLDAPISATRVDVRDLENVDYSVATLPPAWAERCRALVRALGLEYAALDLLVDREGEAVFLDANPYGNFLFYQQMLPELDFLGSLVGLLTGREEAR